MTTMKNDPAYPTVISDDPRNPHTLQSGLTKREYFASLFLQGLLSNPEYDHFVDVSRSNNIDMAIIYADQLVETLNKIED